MTKQESTPRSFETRGELWRRCRSVVSALPIKLLQVLESVDHSQLQTLVNLGFLTSALKVRICLMWVVP